MKTKKFTVGIVQNDPKFLDIERNIAGCLAKMSLKKADFWVLPEFFASGYNFSSRGQAEKAAESIPSGRTSIALLDFAAKNDCAVAAGIVEKSGKKLFNSAILAMPDGWRVYRKSHLFFNEKLFFSKGDTGYWVEKFKGVSLGLMICFDWFFPEACRTLALKGAQIVAHPANLVLPWGPSGMRIRSLENRIFTVTANRIGTEKNLTFIGQSQLVSPRGEILIKAPEKRSFCATARIDAALALRKRITPHNDLFKDRRTDLFSDLLVKRR